MNDLIVQSLTEVAEALLKLSKVLSADTEGAQPFSGETTSGKESAPVAPRLEDVRAVLADISRKGKTAEMKALLAQFGAAKLSDIPVERYDELLIAAKKVEPDA